MRGRGQYCNKYAKEINIEKTKENKSKKSKFDLKHPSNLVIPRVTRVSINSLDVG